MTPPKFHSPLMPHHSQSQVELRFTPTSGQQPLFGDDWRLAVSKQMASGGQPTPQACLLFNHESDGRTRNQRPKVCFLATKRWVSVLATGQDACDAVASKFLDLVLASQGALGPCAVEHHQLSLGLAYSGRPIAYRVRSFVGSMRNRGLGGPMVQRKLVSTLNNWAQTHGVCAETEAPFDIADVMLEAAPRLLSPLIEESDKGRVVRERAEVQFYMPWRLSGRWMVGAQNSKGHGLVQVVGSQRASANLEPVELAVAEERA